MTTDRSNSAYGIDNAGRRAQRVVSQPGAGYPSHDKIVNHVTALTGQINFTWNAALNGGRGIRTVRLIPQGSNPVIRYVVNPADAAQGALQLASVADTVAAAPVQGDVIYRQVTDARRNLDEGLIITDAPIILICAVIESGTLNSLRAEAN